ncbi:autophagy-related protein 2 homolog A isoform X3 [Ornithorhynchus anatinus]|uniref:autophagy-related protein 2 homolog A isoform X3 n=1 Tax=Ornithorhynchus anatinus TaxID=9258 RepID=UPI0010A7F78E|nr:autophagy-related protein 2 homolog A isoform X3 [Ornithorhynchus anatinus]
MSRWLWPWSSCMKKRACRYLLQHYLGHFLQERLSLDQLSLDLYQGSGALRDIHLEIWSVNELLESVDSPLELVDGFVGSIEVAVPWAALLTDHCTMHVTGLQLTLRPRSSEASGGSESQGWASCMTTSLQLAQECLREGPPEPAEPPQPLEGLEMFAQTIETVLRRIKATFLDTIVRVEHAPGSGQSGLAVEIHIQRLEYCDEAVRDPAQAAAPVDVHQPPAFVHKLLQLSGVRLHYEEFTAQEEPPAPPSDPSDPSDPSHLRSPSPPLQIGSCSGYMELTVKLKQNEAFPGPKLEVSGQLGSLHLLLAPQQILQLQDLLNTLSLAEPKGPPEKPSASRPLGAEDLRLIEQDLSQQLHGGAAGALLPDADPFTGMDSADLFFSMAALTSSVASARSVSELSLSDVDLGSSLHSEGPPRRPHPALHGLGRLPGKAAPAPPLENLRPESLMKVTLGGVTLTALQQPPGVPPGCPPDLSARFFAELDAAKDGPFASRDFRHLRPRFLKACPRSHVRLTGAAVQLNWEQRAGSRGSRTVSSDLRFGQLEVLECLWPEGAADPEYTEILSFPGSSGYEASARPCAHLRYTQTQRRVPKSHPRRSASIQHGAEMTLELADFQTEVELGSLDRFVALLHLATTPQDREPGLLAEQPPVAERQTAVRVAAPKATVRLRFPIPDLRAERAPWRGGAVRGERLLLLLSEPEFRTELSHGPGPPHPTCLELTCSDLHGTYEDGEKPAVPCLRVSKAPDPKGPGRKYILPKVVVTLNPQYGSSQWDLVPEKGEDLELSSAESPCELREPSPSPFSSKRTMYETEEMVIPGDPEEMAEFQSRTLALSRCGLELTLPAAHIFLPSKEVYESLYNRINNNLLMWEPGDLLPEPGPPSGPQPGPAGFPTPPNLWHDHFKMCKSAFKLDSDSEEEDVHFFSVEEPGGPRPAPAKPRSPRAQSSCSTLVTVLRGRITALCEAKGESGRKLEDSHGELVLDVEQGTIFSVTQYRGQPGLGYLCLEADKAALYHRAVVEDYLLPGRLQLPSFTPPAQLAPTIYPSEEGVAGRETPGRKGRGPRMLSSAVRIHLDPCKNIKEFLVTLRLHGATLRHHMALPNQSWYSQLLEFLDVLDEPILGFLPPTVITVLHTHLFSCAVDYRPLYLPVRVLITAETFTLSSNIVMDTSTFLLRFILDDSAIYLSDKCEVETLDLRKDYVCVLDVDLLELVIKTWKGSTEGKPSQPLFELRCSNNVVHLHSCADSCALLANLLQYVVNSGDLHPPPRPPSPTEIAGQKVQLSESPASLPSCPPAETALINQRDLTDALIDTERSLRQLAAPPGEQSGARPPPPPASPPEGSMGASEEEEEEEEEEQEGEGDGDALDSDDFCILDAPGLGIPPRNGEPVVTQLQRGPITVRDGHFSRPLGSTDLLRAPARFPVPTSRLVLREVSLVWHLYGGRDFGSHHSHRTKPGLSGPRGSPSRCSGPNRPQNSWRTQGGSGRQHQVLMEIQLSKVSFQHETYPEEPGPGGSGERPLARQVFIVQELEIRDRLASSQINKFLYLHTSEKMPRRAHSNMLTIKALHVAPEAGLGGPECCLRVSLMPLRLNVDQDALFFLKDFFTSLAAGINPVVPAETAAEARPDPGSRVAAPQEGGESRGAETAGSLGTTCSEHSFSSSSSSSSAAAEHQPIYFREFRFTSEVPIWLDYHGKHVTMDQVGTFAGILIGLAQLNCSELKLKRLCCRHGLLGVDKVLGYALNEWLQDIRKNQLPGLLGGVGPMHSVVQLYHGLRDLLWLPIEQYRRDGRIMRGLQRGAASFGSSTASAALELSNRLVQAIQATAETVYDILSPAAPVSRSLQDKRSARRLRRGQQPADLREGVAKAYDTVREGILDTAQTICDVASRGHEQKGLTGAVGGVIRQLPPTVVKPLILATEATSNLLGGMRNQILPDAHKDHALKWRSDEARD